MRRPIAVAAVALALGSLFVAIRLAGFDGDATRFIVAGDHFTDPAAVPGDVHVLHDSTGYDGQYFYRLALDPLTDKVTDHGITLVSPAYNQQRIAYPTLAWAASLGGRPGLLPAALIGVNLLALFALAWAAAVLAKDLGRSPAWGLIIALYPGFWITLARDLTELVAAAGLVAGLVLWRRNRAWAAAGAFTVAVLARETTALVPLALALVAVVGKRRMPPVAAWVPLAAAALWQLFLWSRWGTTGPGASGDARPSAPLRGLVWGLRYQLRTEDWTGLILALALVAAVGVGAVLALRPGRAGSAERLAFAGAALVLLSASRFVWVYDPGFLRAGTEMWILAAVLVLGHRGGESLRRDAALATGTLSASVALLHVTGV